MIVIFGAIVALFFVVFSVKVFGVLINPITLYVVVWGGGIVAASLNWAGYVPISSLGWWMISLSVLSFCFGGGTVICFNGNLINRYRKFSVDAHVLSSRTILRAVVLLTLVASVGTFFRWMALLRLYGSVENVILNANQIYSLRVAGEAVGSIPYTGCFGLAACALSGIYWGGSGRFRLALVAPFVIVTLESIANVGRLGIMMGIILYMTGFLVAKDVSIGKHSKRVLGSRSSMCLLILVVGIIVGSTYIRVVRHGNIRDLPYAPKVLESSPFWTAAVSSIYSNIAGPLTVFAESLDQRRADLGQSDVPGMLTLAPVFRLLAKTGLVPRVSYYLESVSIGPERMNAGTHLKDVYIDFGYLGVVVWPYLLGCIAVILFYEARRKKSLLGCVALSYVYLYIIFTTTVNLLRLGQFVIALAVSLATMVVVKRLEAKKLKRPRLLRHGVQE